MKRRKSKTMSVGLLLAIVACISPIVRAHCAMVSENVTFYFGIETPDVDPNHPTTVDSFHTDLEVSFRSTGWDIVVSYDGPEYGAGGLDVSPVEALLYGNPSSRWVLASIPAQFEFIGAKPNEPFWVLPQNAISTALPLGIAAERTDNARLCVWNPEEARGADTLDRWIRLQLLDVRGPADANFAMWQADGIRPPVVFMSTHDGGITAEDVYYVSAGSHVHMNWGFTKAGLYEVDFQISTIIHCDEWLTADWAPLGNEFFNGDCVVDFQDFALLSSIWLQSPDWQDPNDPVAMDDLVTLSDQWLGRGYPESQIDPNEIDQIVIAPQP